jgi:pantetheine-phosphate adenylyltransferase
MPKDRAIVAVYPGAFDPITNGHIDIIRRGQALFDQLIVAVGHNPAKAALFSPDERSEMINELVADLDSVSVQTYEGLTVTFAGRVGARVILRGIRDYTDLHYELLQAGTNLVVGDIETVFLTASVQHDLTSSSLIKQIVSIGGYDPDRLARLVPDNVAARLQERFGGGSD